jgi:hypothetical protein
LILDAEIAHGYSFQDVRKLAGYAAHRSHWVRAMPAQDRFDLALSAIAEFLVAAEDRPAEQEMAIIGVQAINKDMIARMRHEGSSYDKPRDPQGPNMDNFCIYWWPYTSHVASHENGIVEKVALAQILPRIKPVHREALLTLAMQGTYDKGAAAIGISRVAFKNLVYRARKEFLGLWHEGEQPSRIWGKDCFGIEGYERDESITVRTLRQRKRRQRKKREELCPRYGEHLSSSSSI